MASLAPLCDIFLKFGVELFRLFFGQLTCLTPKTSMKCSYQFRCCPKKWFPPGLYSNEFSVKKARLTPYFVQALPEWIMLQARCLTKGMLASCETLVLKPAQVLRYLVRCPLHAQHQTTGSHVHEASPCILFLELGQLPNDAAASCLAANCMPQNQATCHIVILNQPTACPKPEFSHHPALASV